MVHKNSLGYLVGRRGGAGPVAGGPVVLAREHELRQRQPAGRQPRQRARHQLLHARHVARREQLAQGLLEQLG